MSVTEGSRPSKENGPGGGAKPMERRDSEARIKGDAPRDIWFYVDILGRPAAALLAASTVALVGWFGQMVLEHHQNARLYTELMSQREQAESEIRKDMFTAILAEFFSDSGADRSDVEGRLLRLELLALNFGETLSLSPLFRQPDRELEQPGPTTNPLWRLDRTRNRNRLRSLARRVSSWQLSRLAVGGVFFAFDVPLAAANGDSSFVWPDDEARAGWELNADLAREECDLEDISREDCRARWVARETESMGAIRLGDIERRFAASFSAADPERKTVQVNLTVVSEDQPRPTEMEFQLGYFDFPMIDNIRLSGDQRLAVVLDDFGESYIKLVAVCFPGLYASQREQPFLNEVINQVHDQTDQ